jgi:molecular chaperone HscA
LAVTAREQTSGVEANIVVKPSYGLSDDEIANMLKDSLTHSKDDALRRALKETQVEAQRLIEAVQSAVKSDRDLLTDAQHALIETTMARLQAAALGDDRHPIARAMNELEAQTSAFAASRMDKTIRQAMTGKRIEDIAVPDAGNGKTEKPGQHEY